MTVCNACRPKRGLYRPGIISDVITIYMGDCVHVCRPKRGLYRPGIATVWSIYKGLKRPWPKSEVVVPTSMVHTSCIALACQFRLESISRCLTRSYNFKCNIEPAKARLKFAQPFYCLQQKLRPPAGHKRLGMRMLYSRMER